MHHLINTKVQNFNDVAVVDDDGDDDDNGNNDKR